MNPLVAAARAAYEEFMGKQTNPSALAWWELSEQGQALWLTIAKAAVDAYTREQTLNAIDSKLSSRKNSA